MRNWNNRESIVTPGLGPNGDYLVDFTDIKTKYTEQTGTFVIEVQMEPTQKTPGKPDTIAFFPEKEGFCEELLMKWMHALDPSLMKIEDPDEALTVFMHLLQGSRRWVSKSTGRSEDSIFYHLRSLRNDGDFNSEIGDPSAKARLDHARSLLNEGQASTRQAAPPTTQPTTQPERESFNPGPPPAPVSPQTRQAIF